MTTSARSCLLTDVSPSVTSPRLPLNGLFMRQHIRGAQSCLCCVSFNPAPCRFGPYRTQLAVSAFSPALGTHYNTSTYSISPDICLVCLLSTPLTMSPPLLPPTIYNNAWVIPHASHHTYRILHSDRPYSPHQYSIHPHPTHHSPLCLYSHSASYTSYRVSPTL